MIVCVGGGDGGGGGKGKVVGSLTGAILAAVSCNGDIVRVLVIGSALVVLTARVVGASGITDIGSTVRGAGANIASAE